MHKTKWNDEEDAKLIDMHARGIPYNDMTVILDRTYKAIYTRVCHLRKKGKLSKRQRFRRHKIPAKAHPLVRELFLIMNRERCSVAALSKGTNINFQTIENWRHRHKPQLELIIACYNYLGYDLIVARKKDNAKNQST